MRGPDPRIGAVLGLSTLAFACAGEGAGDAARELHVMSFNVLCVFCGGDEFDPWEQRVTYFRDLFKRHTPDLIGLQELTFAADVEEVLGRRSEYTALYFTDGADSYADATIFYRSDRFAVLDSGFYWLSPTPDAKYSKGYADGQVVPRLVAWGRFSDLNAGGRQIELVTTHFDNNAPAQDRSAPLVLERTALAAQRGAVIVTGDFNSQTYDPAYRLLTTGTATVAGGFRLTNASDLAAELRLDTDEAPPPEYPLPERIDHIFLAGAGTRWRVPSWTVDLRKYGDRQRYPSDHRAITAVVDFD